MREFSYSSEFDPPAPALDIGIGTTSIAPHDRVLALIDTGSDMTSVPPSLIDRLGLPQVNEVVIEAFDATGSKRRFQRPVVSAHLDLGESLPAVNVQCLRFEWETPDSTIAEHVVLGRDILNGLLLALNGPELRGTIALPTL